MGICSTLRLTFIATLLAVAPLRAEARALSGVVRDIETGQEVPGVTVSLAGNAAKEAATTDNDGVFVLPVADSTKDGQRIRLQTSKSGYLPHNQILAFSTEVIVTIKIRASTPPPTETGNGSTGGVRRKPKAPLPTTEVFTPGQQQEILDAFMARAREGRNTLAAEVEQLETLLNPRPRISLPGDIPGQSSNPGAEPIKKNLRQKRCELKVFDDIIVLLEDMFAEADQSINRQKYQKQYRVIEIKWSLCGG